MALLGFVVEMAILWYLVARYGGEQRARLAALLHEVLAART